MLPIFSCDEQTWETLRSYPSLTMTQAALLAAGTEPFGQPHTAFRRAVAHRASDRRNGMARLKELIGQETADFSIKVYRICERWACVNEAGSLQTFTDETLTETGKRSPYGGAFADCRVRPRDFAAFCIRQDWAIPEGMAAFALQDDGGGSDVAAGKWPWGDHETKLLGALAAAAREWWSGYEAEKPGTAPTNNEVATWLQEAHEVSERIAKVMATILRADGLKDGPRPKR